MARQLEGGVSRVFQGCQVTYVCRYAMYTHCHRLSSSMVFDLRARWLLLISISGALCSPLMWQVKGHTAFKYNFPAPQLK